MLTIETINDRAKKYAWELWGKKFNGIIRINNRLTRTLAWYLKDDNNKPIIEINKELLQSKTDDLFIDDILIHELCHWYCEEIGENNNDGDPFFEKELIRIGVRSSYRLGIIDGCNCVRDDYYVYKCKSCENKVEVIIFETESNRNTYGNCCGDKLNISGKKLSKLKSYKPSNKLFTLHKKITNNMIKTEIDL